MYGLPRQIGSLAGADAAPVVAHCDDVIVSCVVGLMPVYLGTGDVTRFCGSVSRALGLASGYPGTADVSGFCASVACVLGLMSVYLGTGDVIEFCVVRLAATGPGSSGWSPARVKLTRPSCAGAA